MFKDSSSLDRNRTATSFDKAYQGYTAKNESWYNGTVDSIDARLAACTKLVHSARSICARFSIRDAGRYLHAAQALANDYRALEALREDLLTGAASRADVQGPPGWRLATSEFNDHSEDFPEAAQMGLPGGHVRSVAVPGGNDGWRDIPPSAAAIHRDREGNETVKVPPGHFDYELGDYAVHDDPGAASVDSRYRDRHLRHQHSSLNGEDQRWVALEAAKFVAANTDCLDDSQELATRAYHHAQTKTSTFTATHSAEVSREFVARVTRLGEQSYRPPVRQAAVYQDFDPQAMFVL